MSRITVSGEVTRVFGKGFDLTESYQSRDGREFTQRYTVWTDNAPMQGDVVTVEGDLSLSVDDWTGRDDRPRHSVKASINRPTITAGTPQEPRTRDDGPSGYAAQGTDAWTAQGGYGDDTPF